MMVDNNSDVVSEGDSTRNEKKEEIECDSGQLFHKDVTHR